MLSRITRRIRACALLTPTFPVEIGEKITVAEILEFAQLGGNLIGMFDSKSNSLAVEVASEMGADVDDVATYAIDPVFHQKGNEDKTLLVVDSVSAPEPILGSLPAKSAVLFRGIAQKLQPNATLIWPVLSASEHAYSDVPNDTTPSGKILVAGKETVLISATQALNNARAVFIGSLEMVKDKYVYSVLNL